jgi:hypothetical protein
MSYKIKINNSGVYEDADFNKYCKNYRFIPTILPATERIIAIGDIHGDYDVAVRSFIIANLIDAKLNWIGGNAVVIQVGDQIDSYRASAKNMIDTPDDIRIIDFFDNMDKKAREYGGAVYSLLGNHELMNVDGDFRYVSEANKKQFEYIDSENGNKYIGEEGRRQVFQPGGPLSIKIGCQRNSVMIIGSNLFVHAGILPVIVNDLGSLALNPKDKLVYLNSIIRKWLTNNIEKKDIDTVMKMTTSNVSPFWTRIYGKIPENASYENKDCVNNVEKLISLLKIGQIVVGHTPQKHLNSTCKLDGEDRLYRIDGGFSKSFRTEMNGRRIIQVLEIINDSEYNIITGPLN